MMHKYIFYIIVWCVLAGACSTSSFRLSSYDSERIAVDSTTLKFAKATDVIQPYRDSLLQITGRVIGHSAQTMHTGKPESLLTNFVSDLLKHDAKNYLPADFNHHISFTVMNVYGLRAPIAEGVIRVGDIFRVMPFENKLSVVGLKGSDLMDLIQGFAKTGGEGVAGISFGIKDNKAIRMRIEGAEIDPSKVYYGIVSDYLADGGNGMVAMHKRVYRLDLPILLRDAIIENIENEKAHNRQISTQLDKRVYVTK